jgi:hypothetical protein
MPLQIKPSRILTLTSIVALALLFGCQSPVKDQNMATALSTCAPPEIMEVKNPSHAFEKGLKKGDLLIEVGQTPVCSWEEIRANWSKKSGLIMLQSDSGLRFVALKGKDLSEAGIISIRFHDRKISNESVQQNNTDEQKRPTGRKTQSHSETLKPDLSKGIGLCSELGFKRGTEKFGECVLKLTE